MDENGMVHFPEFLDGLHIRSRHEGIRQIRIATEEDRIQLMYEETESIPSAVSGVMGIDPGVNNLLTICMNNEENPVLIDGKAVKSINQYYNKRKAQLQSAAMLSNNRKQTKAMQRLTRKRNLKIRDYMHKASRTAVRLAKENGIGTIG